MTNEVLEYNQINTAQIPVHKLISTSKLMNKIRNDFQYACSIFFRQYDSQASWKANKQNEAVFQFINKITEWL